MAFLRKFARRSDPTPEDLLLQGVIANLNNILNTRKGYGSFLHDFGIRDMNEFISRDHIALAVMKEVEENIRKYEPRVELVKITRVDDDNPLRLSFRIECRLRDTSQSIHMVFDSVRSSVSLRSNPDASG